MKVVSPILAKFLRERPPLPPLGSVPVQETRAALNKEQLAYNETAPKYDVVVQSSTVPTSYGSMPIRLYFPPNHEGYPTLIFIHGGGFVLGNLDSVDVHCRELAHFAQCSVVSVEYPLAPEHPFPAAPEASYESVVRIANHLENWKADPSRLYISGASAGGTLAAVVTQMIRDRGGPQIRGQILLCPMTDMHLQTPSFHENATGTNLTSEQLKWFVSQYCPDTSQYNNPLASPLRAKSLENLPQALVVTAECDPLKDDGELYAKKLKEDRVPCDVFCYPGMVHCFSIFPLNFPEKRDVINKMKDFMHK